jgi:hypothetical protein
VTLFEIVATDFSDASREDLASYTGGRRLPWFIELARVGFFGLYGFVGAVGVVLSCLANPRGAGRTAFLTLGVVLLFMLLTLPLAEFLNACAVSRSCSPRIARPSN